jgi:hypothetical protein
MKTDGIRRKKRAYGVHIEIVQRAGKNNPPHRRNGQHKQKRRAFAFEAADIVKFRCAAFRFIDKPSGNGANHARNSGDVKGCAPAIGLRDKTADGIAQGNADWQTKHKY